MGSTKAEDSGLFQASDNGGYARNDTASLTEAELSDASNGKGAFKGVKPGDTIEIHWVHESGDRAPGEGLGACLCRHCPKGKVGCGRHSD